MTPQQRRENFAQGCGELSAMIVGVFVFAVIGAWLVPLFFPCVFHGGTVGTLFGVSRCADGTWKVRQ